MAVYAMLVIVLSQLSWYWALKRLAPAAVTRWTVLTPALAVAYAFVINGERPGVAQISALGFVTAGILVSNLGKLTPPGTADSAESSVSAS